MSSESMTPPFFAELADAMTEHGFRQHPRGVAGVPDAKLLMKRQTWNTNRALVVVEPSNLPADISAYLRTIRSKVAFACGFLPVFWGIGIQVVLISSAPAASAIDVKSHVALVDNQWAIVQSLFVVDVATQSFRSARAWAQFVTGKFQDTIASVLTRHFRPE